MDWLGHTVWLGVFTFSLLCFVWFFKMILQIQCSIVLWLRVYEVIMWISVRHPAKKNQKNDTFEWVFTQQRSLSSTTRLRVQKSRCGVFSLNANSFYVRTKTALLTFRQKKRQENIWVTLICNAALTTHWSETAATGMSLRFGWSRSRHAGARRLEFAASPEEWAKHEHNFRHFRHILYERELGQS